MATSSVSPKTGKIVALPDQTVTIGTASDGGTGSSASIAFTTGSVTTGGPVNFYTATSTPGSFTGTSGSSPVVVSGLTTGTSYTFKVKAGNASGYSTAGESAASNSVAPVTPTFLGTYTGGSFFGVNLDSSLIPYWTGNGWNGVKTTTLGSLTWQRKLASADYYYGYSGGLDSSNNYYNGGTTWSATPVSVLAKYDSSGTLQWQKYIQSTSNYASYGSNIVVRGTNIIMTGQHTPSNSQGLVVKWTAAGGITWTWALVNSGANVDLNARHAIDSAGNVYAGGNSYVANVVKLSSSGVLQWQRALTSSGSTGVQAIITDSSDNPIVVGTDNASGSSNMFVAKYNSSGTVTWQRNLGGAALTAKSVAVDSADNIYVVGYSNQASNDVVIAKWNSSGTIQWQRKISSSGSETGYSIAVDSTNNWLYFGGSAASGGIYGSIPTDGSKTGTVVVGGVSYSYAATTFTESAGSLTNTTTSYSDAAPSYTVNTATYTASTPTGTATITTY